MSQISDDILDAALEERSTRYPNSKIVTRMRETITRTMESLIIGTNF